MIIKKIIIVFVFVLFTSVVQSQNKEVILAFTKSYKHESAKNYKAAILDFSKVCNSKSYEINLRLGWLNFLAGNTEESILYYNKAIAAMPMSTEPKWALISVYAQEEDWFKIENQYLLILEIDPKNITANYNLGTIYYYRKEYVRAKKYFDVALNLVPFGYDNMLMSAWTNYFLGNINDALVLFHKVLLYNPNDISALEGISLIK